MDREGGFVTVRKKKTRLVTGDCVSTADLSDSVDISPPLWEHGILNASGKDSRSVEVMAVAAGAYVRW
jgi:hypothetical protein